MDFWRNKRVLITGHTGFKGSWLSAWLVRKGAQVAGLALQPDTSPNLFDQLGLARQLDHAIADIRDARLVAGHVARVKPEIVFHMAAQPLVRRSYREPLDTFASNVMGTAHVLDALRALDHTCAVVVVTTDKVYRNREWDYAYREDDELGGHDPYSASKAATELVAAAWRSSFFHNGPIRLATARAGNVIGGGDWAEDRIFPDLARAFTASQPLVIRSPQSTRPWQHVLEPLSGYMDLAERLYLSADARWQSAFNFGPETTDWRSVLQLAEEARRHWPGEVISQPPAHAPHEAGRLAVAIDKARMQLGWSPRWGFARGVRETALWYRQVAEGQSPLELTAAQITAFEASR